MLRVSILPVALLAIGMTCGAAPAQSPPSDPSPNAGSTEVTRGPQSTANPGAAARRQKRAQCDSQARQEKLRLFARMKYLRQCIKS
jgi:hypothetical protein